MKAEEVENRLTEAGLRLRDKTRLPDDRGYQLRFDEGQVVTVYDTGTVVPQGQDQEKVREALGLETPAPSGGYVNMPSRTASSSTGMTIKPGRSWRRCSEGGELSL